MIKKYSMSFAATLGLALGLCSIGSAQSTAYPTDLVNIAAASNGGRVLTATSTFEDSEEWSADNLIDGQVHNPQTNSGSEGWSSNRYDPINRESVTLAFADNAVKQIGKIVLNPSVAVTPSRWAKDVEVQVSTETAEGPYRTAAMLTLRREAKPQAFLILPTQAKFVKLVFRSNHGSDRAVALGEVEIYEAIPTHDNIGQLIQRMHQAVVELEQYRELEVRRRNSATLAQNETNDEPLLTKGAVSQATLQLIGLQMAQLEVNDDATSFPVSDVNIAAARNGGKIMNYSSLFGNDPAFAAKNLIDGRTYDPNDPESSAGWASEGFTPGREYVTLGFKDDRTHLLGKIVLNPSSNQAVLRWARRVDVQVTSGSATDGPWRRVTTLNLRSDAVNQEFLISPVEAKYVRLVFQANGPSDINLPGMTPGVNSNRSVSLGEVEIYEATSATDVLDSVIGRFKSVLADLINLRPDLKELYQESLANKSAPAKPSRTVHIS